MRDTPGDLPLHWSQVILIADYIPLHVAENAVSTGGGLPGASRGDTPIHGCFRSLAYIPTRGCLNKYLAFVILTSILCSLVFNLVAGILHFRVFCIPSFVYIRTRGNGSEPEKARRRCDHDHAHLGGLSRHGCMLLCHCLII
jgi:hypothetical protein